MSFPNELRTRKIPKVGNNNKLSQRTMNYINTSVRTLCVLHTYGIPIRVYSGWPGRMPLALNVSFSNHPPSYHPTPLHQEAAPRHDLKTRHLRRISPSGCRLGSPPIGHFIRGTLPQVPWGTIATYLYYLHPIGMML